tara:strand:+ start:2623 stop:3492 length:870 start_codon:yes stop_codon:yes gene_type:complete
MNLKTLLTFDDVLLVPQYSNIKSRKEVSLSSEMPSGQGAGESIELRVPIIASPMDTVCEAEMAKAMAKFGGIGIIHRYNTIAQQAKMVERVIKSADPANPGSTYVGAAIGITGDFVERADALVKAGAKVLCLDVAHGDHVLMQFALHTIRDRFKDKVHIMAGNVATYSGALTLAKLGVDSIRAGIGGGCFVPGTMIRCENEDKPIEKIEVGDKVYTHTGELHEVIDTLQFDRNEELMVIDGIECTKNHEFYVLNKKYQDIVNENNLHKYAEWVEAQDLDKERHLVIELE